MGINSSRTYKGISVNVHEVTEIKFTINDFIASEKHINFEYGDTEFMYALQDDADRVLDLRVGESIFVNTNRDNPDFKGVVIRLT